MSTALLYHGFGLRRIRYKKVFYRENKVIFHAVIAGSLFSRVSKVQKFPYPAVGSKKVYLETQDTSVLLQKL